MKYSRILVVIVALSFLLSGTVVSKNKVTIQVYHGKDNSSLKFRTRIVGKINNGVFKSRVGNELFIGVRKGSEVVVEIINANPYFYTYKLETEIDSSESEDLEFTNVIDEFKKLFDILEPSGDYASAIAYSNQFNINIEDVLFKNTNITSAQNNWIAQFVDNTKTKF